MREEKTDMAVREECRNILWRYMELCDVPARQEFAIERLRALFTRDAEWIGFGKENEKQFGVTRGAQNIAQMLSRHLPPRGRFHTNVHLLCAGSFGAVDRSGEHARVKARWRMLRLSRFTDDTSETIASTVSTEFEIHADGALIRRYAPQRLDHDLGVEALHGLAAEPHDHS